MLGSGAFVAFLTGLHATQFALQPIVTRMFVTGDNDKGALVIWCEAFKVLLTVGIWTATWSWGTALRGWSARSAVITAGAPSLIYSVQNVLIQLSYQHLDGVSFNVVNQTKFIFTAIFLYVLYDKRQSRMQVLALGMMFVAAVLLTAGKEQEEEELDEEATTSPSPAPDANALGGLRPHNSLLWGYLPCFLAAMLSGVASAFTENIYRAYGKKDALLYSVELAVFSALALLAGGALQAALAGKPFTMLSATVATATDDWRQLLPAFLNAAGGLVVGMLIKYAGAIYKGFATMGAWRGVACGACGACVHACVRYSVV